ncbi:hypothetical protein GCM10007860_24820 [Chitiniphilus shinanonensis]|uniref:AsmA family protein n=1 Tax=Chitiniphilus shinanonensis TaxID=553088 RepID=A0ABQ6BU95_9NEIS|nr:hypothetical protein [Chitiniphilus shinanonensis]GLS05331.1 hypothetical protein GCM10007860_24820 [Chitiniphilus shinanonensis]
MGKLKITLFLLLFLILLILALPFLVPVNLFAQPVLDLGKRITHGQFEAQNVRIEYYPAPALVLENVTLAKEGAEIERLVVPANLRNVMAWGESLQGLRIEGGRFSTDFATHLHQRLKPEPGAPRLAALTLERTSLIRGKEEIGPVNGELRFGASGELTELYVTDNSGQLELQVQPGSAPGQFAMQLNATGWELPLGHPVKFDFLRLKGVAGDQGLDVTEIRGDLYGGVVTGSAKLAWGEQGWQLSGDVRGSGIQAEPFSKVFSPTTYATGRLESEARFVYQGTDYHNLFDHPGVDATVLVRDGMLHNFDLVTPLKSSTPVTYSRGGQTRFDAASAKVAIRDTLVQFSNAKVDGGKFSASGYLAIRDGKKLDGAVQARLASGPISVSNQIRIAGELATPEFRTGAAYRPRQEDTAPTPTPEP